MNTHPIRKHSDETSTILPTTSNDYFINTPTRGKQSSEVFGISPTIHNDSYVDRGKLDARMNALLGRDQHIALKAPSKAGKTWLRKKVINNPIEIQCRIDQQVDDIYTAALATLGIKLEITRTEHNSFSGQAEAEGEGGVGIFARARAKLSGTITREHATEQKQLKQDITNLDFIAECIKESGRRLVIEDFHYLPRKQRQLFAFELKALWELGVFVIVVGVWEETNYLLSLNHDLAGKVEEISIRWNYDDLRSILLSGGRALNVQFSEDVIKEISNLSYKSAGILQALALKTLDAAGIYEWKAEETIISDIGLVRTAAEEHAEQISSIYENFAKKVAKGIRQRTNSTGIYAYTMEAIMKYDDAALMTGVSTHAIYDLAHARQGRINLGNLRNILGKLESIHTDEEGRGLILQYSEDDDIVSVVDHQLLLYRRFRKTPWPWDVIISEIDSNPSCEGGYEKDN